MGQYHLVANLDKKEYLNPHQFGDGLKMLEFGCSQQGTLLGLTILLACSHNRGGGDLRVGGTVAAILGRWAGNRIAIIGDYSTPEDFPGLTQEMIDDLWGDPDTGKTTWVDISEHVVAVIELDSYVHDYRFSKAYAHNDILVRNAFGGIKHRSVLHPDGTITSTQTEE